MKRLLPLFFLFTTGLALMAQLPVPALFVNDNSVLYANTETVLEALGESYPIVIEEIFDATDSMRSPTYAEMKAHRLVIWYTSTDGVGRWFWNGDDSDNTELMAYLEDGGMLWVMGNDFLYDRYGTPPYAFAETEFPYHYLGIQTYEAQSYGDDGGLGVETMAYIANSYIASVPASLYWVFPTLWWADGCVPVASTTEAFYEMAPETYALSGLKTALVRYNGQPPFITTVSLFFDPALIDSHDARVVLFSGLGGFFSSFMTYGNPESSDIADFLVYPNPFNTTIEIAQNRKKEGAGRICRIQDALGRTVSGIHFSGDRRSITLDGSTLPSGTYILQILEGNRVVFSTRIMKL